MPVELELSNASSNGHRPEELDNLFDYLSNGVSEDIGPMAQWLKPGGKKMRGRFTLLLGQALGAPSAELKRAAIIAELVHQASILHDDCVDGARLRRGKPTVNSLYGDKVGIMLGDIAVTEALSLCAALPQACRESLVSCIRDMAVGELMEEMQRGNYKLKIDEYRAIAEKKTGALFGWCGFAASHIARRPQEAGSMASLGLKIGLVFQMIDDILDYEQGSQTTGKGKLQDIATGRVTYPLLRALEDDLLSTKYRGRVEGLFQNYNAAEAAEMAAWLEGDGFLKRARTDAALRIEEDGGLLARLPDQTAVVDLGNFFRAIVTRQN